MKIKLKNFSIQRFLFLMLGMVVLLTQPVVAFAQQSSVTAPVPENPPPASPAERDTVEVIDESEVIEVYDPIEGFNRMMFAINQALDIIIFEPIAILYNDYIPPIITDRVDDVLTNFRLPAGMISDFLQGDFENAEKTAARFWVNTIAGVGGLVDFYPELPIEDFGQTLAVWGVGEGPYLFLPLVGPLNARDGVGKIVDTALDPISIITFGVSDAAALGPVVQGSSGVHTRAQNIEFLDRTEDDSLDFYARLRSIYTQHRRHLINDKQDEADQVRSVSSQD